MELTSSLSSCKLCISEWFISVAKECLSKRGKNHGTEQNNTKENRRGNRAKHSFHRGGRSIKAFFREERARAEKRAEAA